MCTVVVLRRPGHKWPLLLAANRDEMSDRPWRPPGRHWPDRPAILAGLDVLGGGTWLGLNDSGVAAAVLNRINTLGPAPGRRSRGELPLLALHQRDAPLAAAAIGRIDPRAYRPFNMVLADAVSAYWLRCGNGSESEGEARITIEPVPAGLSMITAYDRNDLRSPRTRRYLPRFRAAAAPRPEVDDWSGWTSLLAAREFDAQAGPGGAMTVVTATGFGTVSASLLALPIDRKARTVWLFAAGRPGEAPFRSVPCNAASGDIVLPTDN